MTLIPTPHAQAHTSHRSGWLRAAILGINDGIVSVSSLMVGVLAASHDSQTIMTAGIAGLVAGALSMAAGEYVSVSTQKDAEQSDIAIEVRSYQDNPEAEQRELAEIFQQRGLDASLAAQVAAQLQQHDPIGSHIREELGFGINAGNSANPLQAAIASACAFAVGGAVPVLAALVASQSYGLLAIVVSSLVALAISGAWGAYVGGGNKLKAGVRVLLGGGIAMLVTYVIGHLIGTQL